MDDHLANPVRASQSKFPLLKLPDEVIMKVVRSMESKDQVSLSYCSKAAKKLIIALKVTTYFFIVRISNTLAIITSFNDFSLKHEICLRSSNSPEAEFKYHLNHLLSILNRSQINDLHFRWSCDIYNINEILNILSYRKIRKLIISSTINDEVFRPILSSKIHSRKLVLQKSSFKTPPEIQKVFIRNYSRIHLNSDISLKLDDLLITNCEKISIYNSILTEKHLNVFLKLWQKGSNPRLIMLEICVKKELNQSVIMDGIKFETNMEERKFENCPKIKNALYVEKVDGTKAKIVLEIIENYSDFALYVWP